MSSFLYILDAFNFIFQDEELEECLEERGFRPASDSLVARLIPWVRRERPQSVLLVFDGSEKGAHRPRAQRTAEERIVLFFTDPGITADRVMDEMLHRAPRPGSVIAISDDKFISRAARAAGVKCLSCKAFQRVISPAPQRAGPDRAAEDPRKYTGLSPREVDEWMKFFGFEEEDL